MQGHHVSFAEIINSLFHNYYNVFAKTSMISTISADAMRYAKRAHNLVARSNRMLLMTFRLGKNLQLLLFHDFTELRNATNADR